MCLLWALVLFFFLLEQRSEENKNHSAKTSTHQQNKNQRNGNGKKRRQTKQPRSAHKIDVCRTTRDQLIILSGLYACIVCMAVTVALSQSPSPVFCYVETAQEWFSTPKIKTESRSHLWETVYVAYFFLHRKSLTQNEILTADNCMQQQCQSQYRLVNVVQSAGEDNKAQTDKNKSEKDKHHTHKHPFIKTGKKTFHFVIHSFGALNYRFN